MTKSLPVVFCVYRETAGPVFASQVVGPAAWLARQGRDVHLLSFVPAGTWMRAPARRGLRLLQESVRKRFGDKVVWLPAAPSRMRSDPLAATALAVWLRRHYGSSPVVLHCRGSRMTELGLKVRQRRSNLVVVFDCRGVDHAEFRYENAGTGMPEKALEAQCQRRRILQERCVRDANRVMCVSEAMARYLGDEYGLHRDRARVIPCVVDIDRFAQGAAKRDRVRAELGFNGKLVVTYSGSLHAWQMPEQCLRLFRLIQECKADAHFFSLTTEPDRMRTLARKFGLRDEDMTVKRVSHEQIPRYLAAGDVGLLLREPSLVNEVASPVKFGEYLAAGLPVIMTEAIGDYSSWARRHSIGVVYEYGAKSEEIVGLVTAYLENYGREPELIRERCRELAKKELSYSRNMALVDRYYDGVF